MVGPNVSSQDLTVVTGVVTADPPAAISVPKGIARAPEEAISARGATPVTVPEAIPATVPVKARAPAEVIMPAPVFMVRVRVPTWLHRLPGPVVPTSAPGRGPCLLPDGVPGHAPHSSALFWASISEPQCSCR